PATAATSRRSLRDALPTSACAKYRLDSAAVERLLQVDEAFLVGPGEVAVALAHHVLADSNAKAPLFKQAHCAGYYFAFHFAGGCHERHAVVTFQMSGCDHNRIRKKPRASRGFGRLFFRKVFSHPASNFAWLNP